MRLMISWPNTAWPKLQMYLVLRHQLMLAVILKKLEGRHYRHPQKA